MAGHSDKKAHRVFQARPKTEGRHLSPEKAPTQMPEGVQWKSACVGIFWLPIQMQTFRFWAPSAQVREGMITAFVRNRSPPSSVAQGRVVAQFGNTFDWYESHFWYRRLTPQGPVQACNASRRLESGSRTFPGILELARVWTLAAAGTNCTGWL